MSTTESHRPPGRHEDTSTSESDGALARYGTALRKQRIVYFGVVGAIIIALIVTVSVAYSHGEVAHTSLHTASTPAPTLRLQSATPSVSESWHNAGTAALGTPLYRGTVIVHDTHTVRGLDARTGKQTWSYSRSDRTVCGLAQAAGTTVAFYRLNGNCDEVTALESGSGARRWTRTLDQDGQPLNGTPAIQVQSYTILVTTPSVVYAIDPDSGYNRWTYARFGCAIEHAVIGSAGALISQNCTDPRCGTLKFCGRGPQLLFRDGVTGTNDKSTDNPDLIKWNLMGNSDVPASADGVVGALNTTTRALDTFDPTKGTALGALTLSPAPTSLTGATATSVGGPDLVWVGGVAALVSSGTTAPTWNVRASSSPTVVSPSGDDDVVIGTARITVPSTTGATILDGNDGSAAQQITLRPAPAAGSLVYPLGRGQLVVSANSTVAYA